MTQVATETMWIQGIEGWGVAQDKTTDWLGSEKWEMDVEVEEKEMKDVTMGEMMKGGREGCSFLHSTS